MRICSSLRSCLGSAELVWRRPWRTILMRTLAVLALFATTVHAQERVGPLTLDQAVGFAIAHHPALQAEAPAEEVRREQVSVARADYLPSVDLSLQINAGTGNVLRGSLYSMKGIPVVSGPPTGRSFNDASLGSVIGVGVSWGAARSGIPSMVRYIAIPGSIYGRSLLEPPPCTPNKRRRSFSDASGASEAR